MEEFQIKNSKIIILKGDITEMNTEAIVNSANPSLMGGGGVDGAIHRKGGPKILEECKKIREKEYPNGLPIGHAVITTGGNLKAKYVIHTVGPIWRGGKHEEAKLLYQAYYNSLKIAVSKGIKTIAFPSISTGAYGYPIEEASIIALKAIKEFLEKEDFIEKVFIVLYKDRDYEVYKEVAEKILK
ncbi:MAG: O-acetyl-ADP-ribose deacetylase [Candidatus Verstraetearchaeota archaeon]|nr:O-acetyl-ADP-ribose deacetylase [Candidatus Verstraetearchaeota archaeon]